MTVIGRLRELLKAASPGPWIQEFEHDYDSGEETTYPIVLAAPGTAAQCARLQIIGGFRDEDDIALADAKLVALAPALATLVVTLSGELKYLTGMLADGAIPSGADMVNALDAIADVEKL